MLGFGQALEKCNDVEEVHQDIQAISNVAFTVLSKYLNAWDERQLMDDEESELVELFDTKTSLENRYGLSIRTNISKYATAADSMTSFIGE